MIRITVHEGMSVDPRFKDIKIVLDEEISFRDTVRQNSAPWEEACPNGTWFSQMKFEENEETSTMCA